MGTSRLATLIAALTLLTSVATVPANAAPAGCDVWVQPASPLVFETDDADLVVSLTGCAAGSLRVERKAESSATTQVLDFGSTADGLYELWSGIETPGRYLVRAVMDEVASSWTPLTVLAVPTVNSAGWKLVGETTYTWGRFDDAINRPVWTEFWVNGRWSRSQTGVTVDGGGYTLPLTYGTHVPGEYVFRVGTEYDGGHVVYTEDRTIERVARPTASHAGVKIVGETANVWGHFDVWWPAPVWTEVWTGAGFSRSQQGFTSPAGNYVLPLTYGANTPDFYWYRVAADIGDGDIARTEPFFFRRVAKPTINPLGTAKVGQPVYLLGAFDVSADYKAIKVWTEVWTGQRWSKSQERPSTSTGRFTIPLTYGANTPGTTRWRVVGQYPEGRIVSHEVQLRRVR